MSIASSEEIIEVIDGPTLRELASTANHEHALVEASAMSMVEHAILAGEALEIAKRQTHPGRFHSWLEDNFTGSVATATSYMRVFRHQRKIMDAGMTSLSGAIRHLQESAVPSAKRGWEKHPQWVRDEALVLREEGLAVRAIAEQMGISFNTAQQWLNPRSRDKENQRRKVRRQEASKAAAALAALERERAIKRAVRKAGAATAEAWAMAERMQDVLAQAHRETEDREAREALSLAGEHYRKMRDEIVRALGVS